jgi:hypothetical protein
MPGALAYIHTRIVRQRQQQHATGGREAMDLMNPPNLDQLGGGVNLDASRFGTTPPESFDAKEWFSMANISNP